MEEWSNQFLCMWFAGLYIFHMSIGLCIPTYHVCNNYDKYIVAMRLYFRRFLWEMVYLLSVV